MFTSYTLERSAVLMGMHIRISLYVDCKNREGDLLLSVDRRLQPKDYAQPRWFEIDTPEKAETWFRRIDMDTLAERIWLERRAA